MKKTSILTAMAAAVTLSSHAVLADNNDADEVFKLAANGAEESTEKANCSGDKANCSGDEEPAGDENNAANDTDREKCVPVVNGDNLVAENKGSCGTAKHSCAGQNAAGESDAWVYVPKGVCDKILAGNFDDIPDNVKSKLDLARANSDDIDEVTEPTSDKNDDFDSDTTDSDSDSDSDLGSDSDTGSDSQSWSDWLKGLFGF